MVRLIVYATFSIYFATQIFSAENESLAFILTFTTYALAFFFRPLGGFLLGRYADLKGRKQAMMLTIMLMAGGSLIIAILPTYAAVGWLAPILLLLARIAQGMSLGGEVSSASAYLAEIAPPNRRGRYSAFFCISTCTAVLLASLLGAFLESAFNFRFGSLADKVTSPRHVRFTPHNGRWTAHPSQHFGCASMSTVPS